jgi:Ca-activated chloride channel family protein
MKIRETLSAACLLVIVVLCGSAALAQSESDDRTLSPYFFVKSDDPSLDQLPLKSTSAEVNIVGVIADVTVTQVYKNEGSRPIEAVYVFPASTRAAVYGMQMTIGERTIIAQIKKKEQARQEYEQARQQGKSASLLEQQRPNVFQMNVANILPADVITVELRYTELLVPADRIYEFVYPTVVGPRYSNQPKATAPASERWVQNPYLHQGEPPAYAFDITVNIAAGLPIQQITCPSHKVDIHYSGSATASVALDRSETKGGNRDYILQYQLAGDRIESGLLLYQGENENFFLMMLQPPERVSSDQIPGREYIFIVDVSGSMYGFPLEISKKLLKDLIGNLRPTDRFNVLLFAGGSTLMAEQSLPATPANIAKAMAVIGNQQGGGGTELLPALKHALSLPRDEGFSRTVVIATDGYVTVEEQAFDLIRNHLGDANLFAFGIGKSVNRHIIEGMAHVGMGEPFVITNPEDAPARAEAFRKMIQSPVLTRIKLDIDGFEAMAVEPKAIPDVLADRPVVVFGKWQGKPRGTITIRGIAGSEAWRQVIDVADATPLPSNAALRYLWARHRIMLLSDYNLLRPNDERIAEVTQLGLTYNLLTNYTSFVAVDSVVRNADGRSTTVVQPLPLPEGVSDYAVGGTALRSVAAAAPQPSAGFFREEKQKSAAQEAVNTNAEMVAKAPTIKIEKVTVTARLSEDALRKATKQKLHRLLQCNPNPSAGGRLVVSLTVNADGTVQTVTVTANTTGVQAIESCIVKELKSLRLPATLDGRPATAVITLLFA